MSLLVEARVMDSMHLELSKPIDFKQGRKIMVLVSEALEQDNERWQWIDATTIGLQKAYGHSEPDYTPVMIKEINEGYGR
jgi:hypothetical protein